MNRFALTLAFAAGTSSLLLTTSIRAELVRYSWSGFFESTDEANLWELQGDGTATTKTDGTPFTLEAFIDQYTLDGDNGSDHGANYAEFTALDVNLTIGGVRANIITDTRLPELSFSEDNPSLASDLIHFAAIAERFGTAYLFLTSAWLSPSTFSLSDTNTDYTPPIFPDTNPIMFGGAGSTDPLVTILSDTPVTGSIVPEPITLTLATLALLGMACRRRRRA